MLNGLTSIASVTSTFASTLRDRLREYLKEETYCLKLSVFNEIMSGIFITPLELTHVLKSSLGFEKLTRDVFHENQN